MEILLGFAHGFDYVFNHFLIGSLIFSSLIVQAGGAKAIELNASFLKYIKSLAVLSFVFSGFWLLLSVHDMADSWNFSEISTAITQTSFSHIWCLKLISFLGFFLFFQFRKKDLKPIMILAAVLSPIPYVLTSHAAAQKNFVFVRLVLDYLHSVTAGIWTGGLFALGWWLGQKIKSQMELQSDISFKVVTRFSCFAMASTVLIGISGIITAYLNGITLSTLTQSRYGLLLVGKFVFFSCALGAAAVNQFIHLRNWNHEAEPDFSKALRREVTVELFFVIIIFMIAGFLARTSLPIV